MLCKFVDIYRNVHLNIWGEHCKHLCLIIYLFKTIIGKSVPPTAWVRVSQRQFCLQGRGHRISSKLGLKAYTTILNTPGKLLYSMALLSLPEISKYFLAKTHIIRLLGELNHMVYKKLFCKFWSLWLYCITTYPANSYPFCDWSPYYLG